MEKDKQKSYLVSQITKESVNAYRTILLIGNASIVFKQIFRGHIISITTADEVKDFLDNYSKVADTALVFEDLSLMNTQVQTYLLKYLEEDYRPIIVLASLDNISPVLLSRFNKIIKMANEVKSDFIGLSSFLEEHENDLKSNYILPELKDESLKYCPEYFYNYKKMSISKHEMKNRNQIIKYI